MQKVLITGVRSSLGGKIAKQFSQDYEIIATNRTPMPDTVQLDITNKEQVKQVLEKYSPDILIHNAALTSPGYCEQNKGEAILVNVEGTKNLIEHFKGKKIIYISTHWIFDGKKGNYTEEDIPNPLNHYGLTKLKSEELVKNSDIEFLIARVSALYGYNSELDSKKFVLWLIDSLKNKNKVKLFTDHITNPTLINDIASALLKLKDKQGIYHVVSSNSISNYDIGLKICEIFNFDKELMTQVSVDDDPILQRGKDLSLNTDKIIKEGIAMIDINSGLRILKEKLDKVRV
ncbi:MAG: SDR family oxidoreductase [Nanoarchaeota archaeon]|nr:SDR family oxidoreductase [Nanoarchaeota archaeon]